MVYAPGKTKDGLNFESTLPNYHDTFQSFENPCIDRADIDNTITLQPGQTSEGNTLVSKKAFITTDRYPPLLKGKRVIKRKQSVGIEQRPSAFRNAPAFSFAGGQHGYGKMKVPSVGGRSSYLDVMGSAILNPGPGGEPGYGHEFDGFAWVGPQGKFGRGPSYAWSKRDAQRFPKLRYSTQGHCIQMLHPTDPNTTTIRDNPGPATYFGGNKSSLMKNSPSWGMLAFRTLGTTRTVDKYEGNKRNTNYVRKQPSLFNSGQAMWIPDLTWTPPPDAYLIEKETALDCKESTKHKNSCKFSVGKEKRPPKMFDALIATNANAENMGPGGADIRHHSHPTSLKKAKYSTPCPARNFVQEQFNGIEEAVAKKG